MQLSGLHFLLTLQCTFECEHCFVWGSPSQRTTMTSELIETIFAQAGELEGLDAVYFEGGEPFLYFPLMVKGLKLAAAAGYRTGVVSNGYWANSEQDAVEWLRPLVGLLDELSVSSDLFHYDEIISPQARHAQAAAEQLGIPCGLMTIEEPQAEGHRLVRGQIPLGDSEVMFKGRAAVALAGRFRPQPWEHFNACPHEDFRQPGRVHLDACGNTHICQGISVGNYLQSSLRRICDEHDPQSDPIIGPLFAGGPAELVRAFRLPLSGGYADACHLCYSARQLLRARFPQTLTPPALYGEY